MLFQKQTGSFFLFNLVNVNQESEDNLSESVSLLDWLAVCSFEQFVFWTAGVAVLLTERRTEEIHN